MAEAGTGSILIQTSASRRFGGRRRRAPYRVRGEFDGQVLEEDVVNGAYLLAWWDVPSSDATVTAFRVNGEWIRAPTMWEQLQAQREAWLRTRDS